LLSRLVRCHCRLCCQCCRYFLQFLLPFHFRWNLDEIINNSRSLIWFSQVSVEIPEGNLAQKSPSNVKRNQKGEKSSAALFPRLDISPNNLKLPDNLTLILRLT
jgi:hypothetical protein